MRVVLLLATATLLTGCVELRTTMVHPSTGHEIVCEGNGGLRDAKMVRDQCVNMAKLQGYEVKPTDPAAK